MIQPSPEPKMSGRWRLAAVVLLLAAIYMVVRKLGVSEHITAEAVRRWVDGAGAWGALLFVAVFIMGLFLHIPGLIFVGAGIAAYGKVLGGVLSYISAVIAVSTSFLVVRAIGGRSLKSIESPLMKRILARMDERPVLTVLVLRLLFVMSPPLNYALGLSPMRFADYLTGSVIGLIPPIAAAVVFFDWLIR